MVYTGLLILHLLSVTLWLGGAVYERVFLVGNIRRLRGSGQELGLIRIMLSSEPFFLGITTALLVTGITMSVMSGGGFFHLNWLGFKQMVMVLVLFGFSLYIGPRMKAVKKSIRDVISLRPDDSERIHGQIASMTRGFDLIHLGVVVNIVLAVWKP